MFTLTLYNQALFGLTKEAVYGSDFFIYICMALWGHHYPPTGRLEKSHLFYGILRFRTKLICFKGTFKRVYGTFRVVNGTFDAYSGL